MPLFVLNLNRSALLIVHLETAKLVPLWFNLFISYISVGRMGFRIN